MSAATWLRRVMGFGDAPPPCNVWRQTDRLILRELRDSDFPELQAYLSDPRVKRYDVTRSHDEAQTRRLLRAAERERRNPLRGRYRLGIVLAAEGRLIGDCELSLSGWGGRSANLGFEIDPRYWNRGFMTEAAREAVRFGFEELGLRRVTGMCHPDNVGSWRVMEKIGMTRQARRVRLRLGTGEPFMACVYSIERMSEDRR